MYSSIVKIILLRKGTKKKEKVKVKSEKIVANSKIIMDKDG
jgi:hypothetical protein